MKKRIVVLALALLPGRLFANPALPELELSLMTGASTFADQPVAVAEGRLGTPLGPWLDLFLGAGAIHNMERTYDDGAGKDYRIETGWTSLGLRPHWETAGGRIDWGISLSSGMGLVQYRYSREYQEEMVWTDEILDRVDLAVTTLGTDVTFSLPADWKLGVEGGWRFTSPLETPLGRADDLSSWYAGFSLGSTL